MQAIITHTTNQLSLDPFLSEFIQAPKARPWLEQSKQDDASQNQHTAKAFNKT